MTGPAEDRLGHVVVVTTSFPTHAEDPSGHFVAAEVRQLRAQGHRVTVLAPAPQGVVPSDESDVRWLPAGAAFGWPGALTRLRERPWRVGGALRFIVGARRELRRLGHVDRVIAHFVIPSAWPIARGNWPRLEVVAHGSDVRLLERLPRPLRRRIADTLAHADVRCVSEELRVRLLGALGPKVTARVAPGALELGPARDRDEIRRELGMARASRVAIVVGRLVAEKRVEVALRALRLVPRVECIVVGDGPERARLELEFPESRFVGRLPRSRTLDLVQAADVLVSASRLEGAPSAVREARALGTRVVSVAAGDLGRQSLGDPGLSVVGGG